MVFSLIFASNSVSLAEETNSINSDDKPVPTLYSPNGNDSNEVKPIPKEWLRDVASSTVDADIEANKKLEERKREENKKKLEVEKKAMEQKLEMAKKNLEKISSPAEIKLFEKIQKIGTALWGIKKLENRIEVRQSFVKPVAVQCVKDAINKKDTALQAAISSRTQSIVGAIEARNACQNSALDKLTAKEQFDANRVCVEAYKKSGNEYNKILEKSKNESWNVYKTDLKACSVLQKNSTSTEAVSLNNDFSEEIMINDGEEDNLIK